jgi:hypothetical protein
MELDFEREITVPNLVEFVVNLMESQKYKRVVIFTSYIGNDEVPNAWIPEMCSLIKGPFSKLNQERLSVPNGPEVLVFPMSAKVRGASADLLILDPGSAVGADTLQNSVLHMLHSTNTAVYDILGRDNGSKAARVRRLSRVSVSLPREEATPPVAVPGATENTWVRFSGDDHPLVRFSKAKTPPVWFIRHPTHASLLLLRMVNDPEQGGMCMKFPGGEAESYPGESVNKQLEMGVITGGYPSTSIRVDTTGAPREIRLDGKYDEMPVAVSYTIPDVETANAIATRVKSCRWAEIIPVTEPGKKSFIRYGGYQIHSDHEPFVHLL